MGLPPSVQLKSREIRMVWPRCENRPFCMPPPTNCSVAWRASVWVVAVSVQVRGLTSDQIVEPSRRWREKRSGFLRARTSALAVRRE
nr:hypothetical protein GCM10017745_68770 [Saccharothrix mutabilis subsp. capreolus]